MTSRRLHAMQNEVLTQPEKFYQIKNRMIEEHAYRDHFDRERTEREGGAEYVVSIATHCSGSKYSQCCTIQRQP